MLSENERKPNESIDEYYQRIYDNRKIYHRKRLIGRIIIYPLGFIIINGSFWVLLWAVGGLKLIRFINPNLSSIVMFPIGLCYCGFVIMFDKIFTTILDKLGLKWIMRND
jgi:hypothetical protein